MATKTRDYRDNEVELTEEFCSSCGQRLDETELSESQNHIRGDRVLCRTHLDEELEILR